MSKTRYFQKRTWKFGIARKHRQKWMFDKFAKPFVYGYVPHRKSSKIRACLQYCLKSKELRLLQPVTFPLLYVMLPLSVAHRSKLAVLCQLAFIHFSPNMASCRSKESSVRRAASSLCDASVYQSEVINSWLRVKESLRGGGMMRTKPWAVFNLFSGVHLSQLMNCFQRWEMMSNICNELKDASFNTSWKKEFYSGDEAAFHWGAGEDTTIVRGRCLLAFKSI